MKSVKPKNGSGEDPKDGFGEPPSEGGGRNAEADFHGQKRSNQTHASTTDPHARLYRKGQGKETKLCFIGHGLMENRHGLLVDACLTQADGHAERVAALHMIEPYADRPQAITLGADKAYDAQDFINELRSMKVTPHVAQNTSGRSSAIDGARCGIAAMLSVSVLASALKRRSDGSRWSPGRRRRSCVARPRCRPPRRGAGQLLALGTSSQRVVKAYVESNKGEIIDAEAPSPSSDAAEMRFAGMRSGATSDLQMIL